MNDIATQQAKAATPSSAVRVRLAEGEADERVIFDLCVLAMRESKYKDLPLAADRLRQQIHHDITAKKTNGIILAERLGPDGNPVVLGLLSAIAGRLQFSEAISCAALIFYVAPEARNSRAALLLLKAFEKWALNRSAYEIAVHVTMGREDDARVSVLLERYGFLNPGGGSHFKRL
ncbi:MAG: hypothetical protein COA62_04040 [Rhodobiaceae bacterium]|nr:MAG: hypothetical protein COA62_04040 [Rhodobiaceae bacterium]